MGGRFSMGAVWAWTLVIINIDSAALVDGVSCIFEPATGSIRSRSTSEASSPSVNNSRSASTRCFEITLASGSFLFQDIRQPQERQPFREAASKRRGSRQALVPVLNLPLCWPKILSYPTNNRQQISVLSVLNLSDPTPAIYKLRLSGLVHMIQQNSTKLERTYFRQDYPVSSSQLARPSHEMQGSRDCPQLGIIIPLRAPPSFARSRMRVGVLGSSSRRANRLSLALSQPYALCTTTRRKQASPYKRRRILRQTRIRARRLLSRANSSGGRHDQAFRSRVSLFYLPLRYLDSHTNLLKHRRFPVKAAWEGEWRSYHRTTAAP